MQGGGRTGAAVAVMAVLLGGGCAAPRGSGWDAPPLYSETPDPHGLPGMTALGPLVEQRASADGRTFSAVRPFWSRVRDPEADRSVQDVLWPVGMFKTRKGELDWRLLPAFGHDDDVQDPESRCRWTVFPVLFGGRSGEGNPYFAVFPLGGTLYEFLGRDYVGFVLFPMYAFSRVNDLRTHSVLWPVFSRTRGDGVYRLRVWPLYGVSVNDERWTKRFVLWPFWTSVRYHYPDEPGGGFVLFPLYGQVDVGKRHSRMLFPPLFKYEWAGSEHVAWNAPWPFLQYSRGATDKFYIWPLIGRKRIAHESQWFALWPVISGIRLERPRSTMRRFRILPLFYYEANDPRTPSADKPPATAGGPSPEPSRYVQVWPLFRYRREGDVAQSRAPALWPLKHTPGIERNWAPLWTLFRRDRIGESRRTDLLWGWIRLQRNGQERAFRIFPLWRGRSVHDGSAREWSFLGGLAGYRRENDARTVRLLYGLTFGSVRRDPAMPGAPADAQDDAQTNPNGSQKP